MLENKVTTSSGKIGNSPLYNEVNGMGKVSNEREYIWQQVSDGVISQISIKENG